MMVFTITLEPTSITLIVEHYSGREEQRQTKSGDDTVFVPMKVQ